MGILSSLLPVKSRKVRHGLITFGKNDDWRAELGPKLVAVKMNFAEVADLPEFFAKRGIPNRYLDRLVDATGQKIEAGKICHFHMWGRQDEYVWHIYRWSDGEFRFVKLCDGDESAVSREVRNLMRKT